MLPARAFAASVLALPRQQGNAIKDGHGDVHGLQVRDIAAFMFRMMSFGRPPVVKLWCRRCVCRGCRPWAKEALQAPKQ